MADYASQLMPFMATQPSDAILRSGAQAPEQDFRPLGSQPGVQAGVKQMASDMLEPFSALGRVMTGKSENIPQDLVNFGVGMAAPPGARGMMRPVEKIAEGVLPIVETAAKKAMRKGAGYKTITEVDANAFKRAFEADNNEDLAWNPWRLDRLRNVEGPIDAYPFVGVTGRGKDGLGTVGVDDGRHRLALAAERGLRIPVAVSNQKEAIALQRKLASSEDAAMDRAFDEVRRGGTQIEPSLDNTQDAAMDAALQAAERNSPSRAERLAKRGLISPAQMEKLK
jgi:hypothetical protein